MKEGYFLRCHSLKHITQPQRGEMKKGKRFSYNSRILGLNGTFGKWSNVLVLLGKKLRPKGFNIFCPNHSAPYWRPRVEPLTVLPPAAC